MKVKVLEKLAFSATAAWRCLGGFDGLPAISSATVSSRLQDEGRIRMLANRDGSILWERLLHFDEKTRTLSYEIVDAKAADKLAYGVGYRGTVRVRQNGPGSNCAFEYFAEFTPINGFSESQARKAVVSFVRDCASGVRRVLGAQSSSS